MEENKQARLIRVVSLSCLVLLIALFTGSLLDLCDVTINGELNIDIKIEEFIYMVMFLINMYFVFSISLNRYDNKIIYMCIGYIPIYILSVKFIGTNLISSTILPLIAVVIVAKRNDVKICKALKNLILFYFITTLYQQASGYIKLRAFNFTYYEMNLYQWLLYSLDLYIFYFIYLMEVKNNAKYFICTNTKSIPKISRLSKENLSKSQNKDDGISVLLNQCDNLRQKVVLFIMVMSLQLAQLAVVLLIGTLNNMLLETTIMIIVFWISRSTMGKSWHSDRLSVCSMVTFTSFFILTKISLPLEASMFCCILLGMLFALILYKAYYIKVKVDRYDAIYTFDLETCTEEQLTERASICGLSKEETEIAIKLFIDKLKAKEYMDLVGASDEYTARNYKSKLKKKLESI